VGASAAAHALLVLVIAAVPRVPDTQTPPAHSRPAEHVAYMEIGGWPAGAYAVSAPADAIPAGTGAVPPEASPAGASRPVRDADPPAVPVDSVRGAGPAPPAVPGVAAAGAAVAGASARPGATRLGLELGDARLVAPPPSSGRAPAPAYVARYEAQFRAAWRAFGDSIQRDMDRERLAASWTWKDPAGRAWSVRDGVLFMDGQRIMAMEMSGDRDQDRAARTESTARREIARQAEDIERARYIEERRRAIRTRRDQQRGQARP
jgi:hypothetical protein